MVLVMGLTYNLFNADSKIDRSFYINKQLDELRVINKDIDFMIKDIGDKNYDEINSLTTNVYKILNSIKDEIEKNSIDDRNILLNLKVFQDKFDNKIMLIDRFKSINAILNNSYKNCKKLKNTVDKSSINYIDMTTVNKVMENMLSLCRTKKIYSTDKLRDIINKRYDNQIMNAFLLNLDIYKDNFLVLQKIRLETNAIGIEDSIDSLISSYATYNKAIVNDIRMIILAFIITLVGFFLLLYMLMHRVGKINKLLNNKTEDLEKSLLTINQNVIYSKSDLNGIITDISEAFCHISGYTRNELLGESHNILGSKEMGENVFEHLWSNIKDDKDWRGEVKNRRKDGTLYWLNTVITPIFDHNNIKVGYSSIRYDISDKIMVESLNSTLEHRVRDEVDKNREKDKQMLQQSRLAQMGEMISMIAHQWRQPLAAISNTSTSMIVKAKLKKLDDKTIIKLATKISGYSAHLSSTIDDFRDFFKSNKELKETTYAELIDGALRIVEVSIVNKNIKLVKNLECNKAIWTYPNEIKQVILNLIKNAEDVLIDKKIDNPTITISVDQNTLEVSDNGGGIPIDIIDKIFDPYFSTKTKKDGTGLGLYMSRTIIERNCGGKLNVFNRADGAVFQIVLGDNHNDE